MIDARIAAPAAAAWAAAVVIISIVAREPDLPARPGVAAGGVAVLAVVAAVVAAAGWRSTYRQLGCLIASAMVLAGASAGFQISALAPAPIGDWVMGRATAEVTGVVVADPVVRTNRNAAMWQSKAVAEVRIATNQVTARGHSRHVELPMLLRAPALDAIPAPGSHVHFTGRLGPSRQSDVTAVVTVREAIDSVAAPGVIDRVANAMRSGLREAVSGAPPDAAALVAGLSVGDESLQPPELDEAMRASGLSHLTAVSGGNVAIVLVVVLALGRLLGLRMSSRVGLALAALGFFVVLVRPQPSVVRAAVMGVVMLLALLSGGRRAGPSVLATAVLVITLVSPLLAATWAFGLSVLATGGLILLSPLIAAQLSVARPTRRLPPALSEALAVTIAAQIATAPLLVAMGASFGWVAIPANLLAMPAVAPVTILGLLAAMLAPIAPFIAAPIAHLAAWPAAWIATVAQVCSALPWAAFPWPTGTLGVLLLIAAFASSWWVRLHLRRRYPAGIPNQTRALLIAPLLVSLVLWMVAPPRSRGWPPPGWLMVMCDVGQGDAIAVNLQAEEALLVDAGPDPHALRRCLDDLHIAALPAIVLTHFHADHVNGLSGALDRSIGAVYVTPIADPADEAAHVVSLLGEQGIQPHVAKVGDVLQSRGVRWRVLWPRRVIDRGSVPNNASVVLALDVAKTSILLPGDIEAEAQTALLAQEPALRVDVMKVPHHGSRNQDARLPAWSGASIALISCGTGNSYGHPAADTIEAWRRVGALIGRTDIDGDLAVVRTDSGELGLVAHGSW